MVRPGWVARWAAALAVVAVFLLAACGGGSDASGASASGEAADVKRVMSTLLVTAGAKGEAGFAESRGMLAAREFDGHLRQAAPRKWEAVPEAERESAARACFNQLLVVANETTLRDTASIEAALAAGRVDVLGKTRTADVAFEGPGADGKQPVRFKCKLVKGTDDQWRLMTCEGQFGR